MYSNNISDCVGDVAIHIYRHNETEHGLTYWFSLSID